MNNIAGIKRVQEMVRAMSVEEQTAVAKELPVDILASELWARIVAINEFKQNFDAFVQDAQGVNWHTT